MPKKEVLVETSARHVHLCKEHVEILFGPGAKLTPKRDLSQPGQFLSEERVDIEGPKSGMKNVAVLGPERSATQIEVSLTDARALGVVVPIRESGDIKGSSPMKITGPCGTIEITEGVIAAKRHIHFTPADAKEYGVEDKQIVSVKISNGDRSVIFGDTVVRVRADFATAMHIDVDEANAAGMNGNSMGEIITIY